MNVKAHIFLLSKYKDMDSAYWGLGTSVNGSIYFALCTHASQKSAMLFSYNPTKQKIEHLFTLADHVKNIPPFLQQGKVHTPLFEGKDGLLYFGTHFAYPHGDPQPVKYEGGHLISYDPKKGIVNDLGIALAEDGILFLIIDRKRNFIYMLTAPSFNFISYDIENKKFNNFGSVTNSGSICRTLTVDDEGNVYGSFEKNKIFRFNYTKQKLEKLAITLPTTKVKIQEWDDKSRGGVNNIGRNIWRCALWNEQTELIYGIHAATSKLFSLNTKLETIKELDFMGSDLDKNHPEAIYPTLSLSQYKHMLFYVPASGFFDYARSNKIKDGSHLVSYDITNNKRTDHGEICDKDGRKVFGVAGSIINNDGKYYLLGAVEVFPNEEYNKHNTLQGKPFHLSLIEIDINNFA